MTNLLLAVATGVGLAAASGLRAFLPLLAVGLAGRFGFLHFQPGMEWLESDPALWSLEPKLTASAEQFQPLAGCLCPMVQPRTQPKEKPWPVPTRSSSR